MAKVKKTSSVKSKLTRAQRKTTMQAIRFRLRAFPREQLLLKLKAADEAFHLAIVNTGVDTDNPHDEQNYSRFSELSNALVREICETYVAKYVSIFLSAPQVFSMTSSKDRQADAQSFNTIFGDQQRRGKWKAELSKFFKDIAKYNLAATDTSWTRKLNSVLSRASGTTTAGVQAWEGNTIEALDLYNSAWDTSVSVEKVSEEGEFGAYTKLYSQVALKRLVDRLSTLTDGTLYLDNPLDSKDTKFSIYDVISREGLAGSADASNLRYLDVSLEGLANAESFIGKSRTDWGKEFGLGATPTGSKEYEVTKMYIRLVPSAFKYPAIANDSIQIWEFYVLEHNHLLFSRPLSDVHEHLPIDLAQTDIDSLGLQTTGPTQVTIPYQKTAKQVMDRILAGADRAISDRAIYDSAYLEESVVNSRLPEAKMPLSQSVFGEKTIDQIYKSISFDSRALSPLYQVQDKVEVGGRKSAGLNEAQQGQFVKGNRTLQEYSDTMGNAADKTFIRALLMEATYFQSLKFKLKLNVIQYQESAKLFNPELKEEIEIKPAELFAAQVDFKLADALMPSEDMVSPQVQQALLQYMQLAPDVFATWDREGLISHILSQSNGLNIEQYKPKPQA